MKQNRIVTSVVWAVFALAFTVIIACSSDPSKQAGSDHSDHAETEEQGTKTETGNPQFQDEKVKNVYAHYIHVKNALIDANVKEAQNGGNALQEAFQTAGNEKGAGLAGKIASSTSIEAQRAEFDALTSEVEQLVKSSKLASGKIFKQFCPMAKDGDGAYWLASESDIKNPYYGNDMLKCGEVKEEIK